MVTLPSSPVRSGGKAPRVPEARLAYDGLVFDIHRSDRRKTLQITVERDGSLSITAPQKATEADMLTFVREQSLWIHTKIAEKAQLQRRAPVKEFVDGEGFLYLGKSHRLRIVPEQFAELSLTNGRFLLRQNRLPEAREAFIAWYTRAARRWFSVKVAEHAKRMGVDWTEVKVQDLGFRWGSFGADGRINFHWKAILLPPRIAEYVVVHELAHAQEPSHSPAFWALVERYLPDWEVRKSWLAEHGISVEGV